MVALDGVELFVQHSVTCRDCLHRTVNGVAEWFHRIVVVSTVGPHRQTVLEWDVIQPADGSDKNEGEPQIGDFPELSRGPLAHLRIIYGERPVTTRKRGRRHPRQRVTKTRAGP